MVVLVALAGACRGSGGGDTSPAGGQQETTTAAAASGPKAAAAATTPTTAAGGSADAAGVGNQWFPLTPGLQTTKRGTLNRGDRKLEHRRVFTITNVTKMVDGRKAVLVLDQDFDGGELAEQAVDYVAIDERGAIRSVGSYTEAYEGGQFVNANDAWLAGVRGAIQGTLMPADPLETTGEFVLTDIPGGERSTAKVLKTGQRACVAFACYDDVVIIKEGDEWKYHAPGVGEIKLEPHYSGGEQETEELINVTELSPQSLAEVSAEALKLDNHARQTAARVFAKSQPAELVP